MAEDEATFENLLVVIGASAGGLEAIREIISDLPEDFQAVVIVATHRDPSVEHNFLADILTRSTRLTVREPIEGEKFRCTTLYVGKPSDSVQVDGVLAHLERIENDLRRVDRIDELFVSAASSARENAIGVILSGMLSDGVAGLKAIQKAGGKCIVQLPSEAKFPSMPENALAEVDADFVGDTREIAAKLVELAAGRTCH